MAISEELAKILAARYGRDVRQAIHDAIEENYEDVSAARTLADSATTAANNAASLANTKAGLADEKASLANTKAGLAEDAATAANNAASLANTKAGLADEKASLANTKAGLADSAATAANNAASLANTKAGLADSAATAANNAASLANTKAGLADSATTAANNAASLANTKAGLADEKASLANTKAGLADSAATAANNAASLANTKAGLADEAAQDATDAAAYANAITQKYIHIRYSAINPDSDDDMVSTPSDWIGIYSGTSASAPTSYTSYAWFKYKGETGDLSIYGVGNADGNIPLNNGVVSVNLNADKLDGLDSTDFAAASHPHVKADITDFPTSMPASDVSAWAKAATKPSYTPSEVGAAPAVHDHDSAYLGKTAQAADSDKLDGVHLADIRLGQNILHNWDFLNPVNQRGVATGYVPSNAYTFDRWLVSAGIWLTVGASVDLVAASGENVPYILQPFEMDLRGKTYTVTLDLYDYGIKTFVIDYPADGADASAVWDGLLCAIKRPGSVDLLSISNFNTTKGFRLKRVKLELGNVSTLHLDPPMDHAVELPKCQRFFLPLDRLLQFFGYFTSGTTAYGLIPLPVPMRATPTLSHTNTYMMANLGTYTGEVSSAILVGSHVRVTIAGTGFPIGEALAGRVGPATVGIICSLSSDL